LSCTDIRALILFWDFGIYKSLTYLLDLLSVVLQLGREVLGEAARAVAVGVTTDELDRIVHEVGLRSSLMIEDSSELFLRRDFELCPHLLLHFLLCIIVVFVSIDSKKV